jgi:predicted phosphodiesterase
MPALKKNSTPIPLRRQFWVSNPHPIGFHDAMPDLRIKSLSPSKGRTLFIGDVHGCAEELEQLLVAFNPKPKDRVIFVGDLINRGPDSARVLQLARELSARCVLGNHEQRFLRARKARSPGRLKQRDRLTYDSLSKEDWKWINSWPHVIQIPSLGVLVVHGGFIPGTKWKNQDPDMVTHIQVLTAKDKPARRADLPNGRPWADGWTGKEHVLYGHTPRPHPLFHANATGLDTGCVYGYTLTGLSLPDHTVYKVPARRPYFDD